MRRTALFLILTALVLGGCSSPQGIPDPAEKLQDLGDFVSSDNRVIVTTGLSEDELFRIETKVCTSSEYLVYLGPQMPYVDIHYICFSYIIVAADPVKKSVP